MKKDRQKASKGIFFKRAQNGFTILEVLIAMAIFAIGILAVASMQISATNGNTNARKSSEASEFGQAQIESLMAGTYANVVNGNSTTADGYSIVWTVGALVDPVGLSVQVTVSDPQGNIRSILDFNRYPDVN